MSIPFAEFTLGDALITTLAIFFFFIWIWIVIGIISDLFRDHELSGWFKAIWVLFLIVIPFVTALIYLIARGQGMRERAIQEQAEVKSQMDQYVRETAGGSSPADELAKLHGLKESGAISAEEYERLKAKVVS